MIIHIETESGKIEIELSQNGTALVTSNGKSMGLARWHQKDSRRLEVFALPRYTFEPEPKPEPPGLHFRFRTDE